MEADIRSEVRNSLPAECISPENGWRANGLPLPCIRRSCVVSDGL
jgi:hypothetical protein